MVYNFIAVINKTEQEFLMKIKTIRFITYGALIFGAFLMLIAIVLPDLSKYMVVLMYVGGAMGVFGMLFCLLFMRCEPCPGCRDFIVVERLALTSCPCCNKSFQ